VEALVGVVNELKAKLNILINDVLGVQHIIDNIHNYDDSNIKEDLQEITERINNVHTDINNITAKLINIALCYMMDRMVSSNNTTTIYTPVK
jgi:iron-sulfur cluster repair protein YtfE (RIC family)